MARPIIALLAGLLLGSCAERYLLVTAGSLLDCPVGRLTVRETPDDYRVSGCGRLASCIRHDADQWLCEDRGPVQSGRSATAADAAWASPPTRLGCGKDNDCKGDRICVHGECVNP